MRDAAGYGGRRVSKPKARPKQRRTTSWDRMFDDSHGAEARRKARIKLGPASAKDIESISKAIRATNLTRVDESGVAHGEAAEALREDRAWSEV